jgi:hypothetical protein
MVCGIKKYAGENYIHGELKKWMEWFSRTVDKKDKK